MNELCHYTTGPDGSIYRVMYRVQGEYDNTETSVKKRMAGNAKINYDDRLCFARIQPSLKGGPHNDDKKNDNGAGTTTGVGNSFIAGKEHLSTTSLTHEIIAHFFWGRGEGTKSHLSNWAENTRQEGPPSIRMICEDGGDIINVPIKFNINGESTCFDKTTRKVLPEDKITLTKKDWLNALYIKNGIPTNTFFNKNVEQIPVSTFNK